LAYHPLRSPLAIGCQDGTVRLWESASRPVVPLPTAHRGRITDVAFGPDGRLLATASIDGTVEIWDVGSRQRLGGPVDVEAISPGTYQAGGVQAVAFDPGGTMLATGADGYVYRVAWVRDRYLVAGSGRTVRVWDAAAGQAGASVPGGPAFAVSPDNRTIATFEPGTSTLLLWSTRPLMPYLD
jgi:WD40 repeat protein